MTGFQTTIPATALEAVQDLEAGRPKSGDGEARTYWKSIDVGAGTVTEVDSLFDLPAKCAVVDCLIEVLTAEVSASTKTLDVGIKSGESGGDADGFADGVSVAATGLFRPGLVLSTTWVGTCTRGALLATVVAGSGTDDRGLYVEKPHVAGSITGKSVSYSRGDTLVEFVGRIWLKIEQLAD